MNVISRRRAHFEFGIDDFRVGGAIWQMSPVVKPSRPFAELTRGEQHRCIMAGMDGGWWLALYIWRERR